MIGLMTCNRQKQATNTPMSEYAKQEKMTYIVRQPTENRSYYTCKHGVNQCCETQLEGIGVNYSENVYMNKMLRF